VSTPFQRAAALTEQLDQAAAVPGVEAAGILLDDAEGFADAWSFDAARRTELEAHLADGFEPLAMILANETTGVTAFSVFPARRADATAQQHLAAFAAEHERRMRAEGRPVTVEIPDRRPIDITDIEHGPRPEGEGPGGAHGTAN
jgi:hypothetical protein